MSSFRAETFIKALTLTSKTELSPLTRQESSNELSCLVKWTLRPFPFRVANTPSGMNQVGTKMFESAFKMRRSTKIELNRLLTLELPPGEPRSTLHVAVTPDRFC